MELFSKKFLVTAVTGVALALPLAGCEKPGANAPANAKQEKEHAHEEGEHATEGPHHGHLIELGKDEFHAELALDEATHTVTIYLLDSTAKQAVPIEAQELVVNAMVAGKPKQFKLPAKPLEGEDPKSSRFEASDEEMCDALCEQPDAKGRLNVTINGKAFVGEIEHVAHDEKEHDHK